MNYLLEHLPIAIFATTIWFVIGWLVVRDQGDVILMLLHDVPWAGRLMLFVYFVLWPIALLFMASVFVYYVTKTWLNKRKTRLILDMPPDVLASLKELGVDAKAGDMSELFRKMTGTYHFITDAKKKGMTFYMVDPQDEHHHVDFP